jgi:hypothetical protein
MVRSAEQQMGQAELGLSKRWKQHCTNVEQVWNATDRRPGSGRAVLLQEIHSVWQIMQSKQRFLMRVHNLSQADT